MYSCRRKQLLLNKFLAHLFHVCVRCKLAFSLHHQIIQSLIFPKKKDLADNLLQQLPNHFQYFLLKHWKMNFYLKFDIHYFQNDCFFVSFLIEFICSSKKTSKGIIIYKYMFYFLIKQIKNFVPSERLKLSIFFKRLLLKQLCISFPPRGHLRT